MRVPGATWLMPHLNVNGSVKIAADLNAGGYGRTWFVSPACGVWMSRTMYDYPARVGQVTLPDGWSADSIRSIGEMAG